VRYSRHHGLQPHPESPFASCFYLFIILSIAGESRFNSHSLTASAANASGFLQVAVSEAPTPGSCNLGPLRAGAPDRAPGLFGQVRCVPCSMSALALVEIGRFVQISGLPIIPSARSRNFQAGTWPAHSRPPLHGCLETHNRHTPKISGHPMTH
jgi:hypothetical protein